MKFLGNNQDCSRVAIMATRRNRSNEDENPTMKTLLFIFRPNIIAKLH